MVCQRAPNLRFPISGDVLSRLETQLPRYECCQAPLRPHDGWRSRLALELLDAASSRDSLPRRVQAKCEKPIANPTTRPRHSVEGSQWAGLYGGDDSIGNT